MKKKSLLIAFSSSALVLAGMTYLKISKTTDRFFFNQELPSAVQIYKKVPITDRQQLYSAAKEIQSYLGSMNMRCISRFIEPSDTTEKESIIGCNVDKPLNQVPIFKDLQVRIFPKAFFAVGEVKTESEKPVSGLKADLSSWVKKNHIETKDYYFESVQQIGSKYNYRSHLYLKK